MSLSHTVSVFVFRAITSAICRVEGSQLAQVPDQGPLILAFNHVNILEAPTLYTRLQPRPVTGLVAAYRWDNPFIRWLMDVAGAIPLHRGEADIAALRKGLQVLEEGRILMIAPEGTRSKHGRLQEAHPGIVLLALRSGAPILPIVHYGSEHFQDNLRRLKRSNFRIAVGQPFHLDAGGAKVTRSIRRQMVNQIMVQMAALLPPAYRGFYSDLGTIGQSWLTFAKE